jgi:hypothetical protein
MEPIGTDNIDASAVRSLFRGEPSSGSINVLGYSPEEKKLENFGIDEDLIYLEYELLLLVEHIHYQYFLRRD